MMEMVHGGQYIPDKCMKYKVNAYYNGWDNVTVSNATITVNKLQTELSADAIITTYNIDKDLVVTLKDSNGNPVTNATITVDLNGAKTYITDTNGQIKVSTAGLVPQIYTAKLLLQEMMSIMDHQQMLKSLLIKQIQFWKLKIKHIKQRKRLKNSMFHWKITLLNLLQKLKLPLKLVKKLSVLKPTVKVKQLSKLLN